MFGSQRPYSFKLDYQLIVNEYISKELAYTISIGIMDFKRPLPFYLKTSF